MYPNERPLTPEQTAYLHNLYYNKKFYYGTVKLFEYTRYNEPSTIPHIFRNQIAKWLKGQKIYQLYKQAPRKKATRHIYSSKKGKLFQADLIDFTKKPSNGYKYVLMIIDTFTRKLFAKPLRNKTAELVGQAIQNIFTENNIQPKVIQTDNGNEFNDINIENAKQIKSNSYTPQNQGIVERANQTIKRMIYKYIKLTGKSNWPFILQELIDNYNDSYHKSIKSSPNKLWNSSQEEQDQVAQLSRKQINKDSDKPLEIGSMVRKRLVKPNKNKTIWTNKIFKITDIVSGKDFSRNRYILMDENQKVLKGYFNNTQLQLVSEINDFPEKRNKQTLHVIDIPRKKQRMEETNKHKASFYIEVPVKKLKAD